MHRRRKSKDELIGLPRIARILHVSHPTAALYASRRYFPTREIDGRTFAFTSDVLLYKAEREAERERESPTKPAA